MLYTIVRRMMAFLSKQCYVNNSMIDLEILTQRIGFNVRITNFIDLLHACNNCPYHESLSDKLP